MYLVRRQDSRDLGPRIVHPIIGELLEKVNSFHALLVQYPIHFRYLLGPRLLGDDQVAHIIKLLKDGKLYTGSDRSVKDECGSHAYAFTNGREEGIIYGGAAITPGSHEEMSSLRAEHGGAISILLILYAILIYLGEDMVPERHGVDIWIDNIEVLSRSNHSEVKDNVKGNLVLDSTMWRVMNMLQEKISIPIRWNKVDSHIEEKVYAEGV